MKRILNNAISLMVVVIVLFLVIPLPAPVLDVLIILNISLSIMILMITMNISEALEFSIFPSLLLVTTLFRLGLNVSSTRLILSKQGEAGVVIKAFGQLITQGNIVIGVLIFLIIVLVQFIVITKGAERVSEVAARFTLDAMPGKQMAIDADLNSGLIDEKDAHPRRPRCKYMGEMIQMDASSHEWISGQIWYLHLAVDDASGEVVGAYFDRQETLKGYYNVFYQILTNYGIPAMFYTDRRTIFEYKRKINAFDDDDTFTQFSYACHNLGVDIKTTSIAQAKGRIERLNQTFQSRLPIELRRAHITDIESANEFLRSYLKKFNDRFALRLNTTKSVFETQPSIEKINCTLAVLSPRKIDAGHSIHFHNKIYIPHRPNGTPIFLKNGTDCMVIESFDANLYVNVLDQIYVMQEVPEHSSHSAEFDAPAKQKKPPKKYVPPMDHPWKRASYLNYLAKQKHRNFGANV